MPAIGGAGVVFLVIQAFVAAFVHRQASAHGRRSPLVLATCTFVVSTGLVFVTDGLLPVLAVQAVAIVIYLAAQPRTRARASR